MKVIAANESGTPDILACCNGKFVGIEVKAGRNKPTKLQMHKLEKIKEAAGISMVAYSVEDVEKMLEDDNG